LIKSLFISALRKRGFTLHKYEWGAHFDAELFDVEPEFRPVAEKFKTRDILRQYAAWKAARYVATCGVPGDVVECGVLHGKSATILAHGLLSAGDSTKHLWLYDTYSPDPGRRPHDFEVHRKTGKRFSFAWDSNAVQEAGFGSEEKTRNNVSSVGFPLARCTLVRGLVQETIPGTVPEQISLLKIHTDFHDSVRHALDHLYPRLNHGGVLIVDAYGRYSGAKQAVDDHSL
jgi:O-methyltransferase